MHGCVLASLRLWCRQHAPTPSQPPAPQPIAPHFVTTRPAAPPPQTFTNDPSGDFSKWAQNPRVVEMLGEAKRLMDQGCAAPLGGPGRLYVCAPGRCQCLGASLRYTPHLSHLHVHLLHPQIPPIQFRIARRYLDEAEVEQFMIRQLQDPSHEAHAEFKRKTRQVRARLGLGPSPGAQPLH